MVPILLFALVSYVNSLVPEDEIRNLPGWNASLPTRQYSGYIHVDSGKTRFLHYWLVESEGSPSSDPLVMWMNGGPGCSSLEGYLYEMGPLHFMDDTPNQTHPQFVRNPNTWVQIANMLFVEAPIGVGYSYSTRGSEDLKTNDTRTAQENLQFLLNFFAAYPEFKENDFYVMGESYAGIYIPTLVDQVRIHNENLSNKINLKGFMVGNGCIGNAVGACSMHDGLAIRLKFSYEHGLISQVAYDEVIKKCGDGLKNASLACEVAMSEAYSKTGNVDIYDIYIPCISNNPQIDDEQLVWRIGMPEDDRVRGLATCIDAGVSTSYLNTPEVRQALHVQPESVIGRWRMCSHIPYDSNIKSLLDIYPTLIKQYRTVIYNGDVDGCVPYIGNEEWTSGLGFPVKEAWRPWMVNDQVAGYVTTYDVNNFTFITVKGSGHMVPQFQPVSAYAMFERYIKKEKF
ncbi:uncharacterized protein LOC134178948 [Corticium candelabrum]|uniref:uncharacterized protein LOC134178948 n=1 Tax=Corticium candelabrum TaxID=121492 RepID=UPI002E27352B|nr:uncharacterized protein LOC134178948 [Corticium candelabrum]